MRQNVCTQKGATAQSSLRPLGPSSCKSSFNSFMALANLVPRSFCAQSSLWLSLRFEGFRAPCSLLAAAPCVLVVSLGGFVVFCSMSCARPNQGFRRGCRFIWLRAGLNVREQGEDKSERERERETQRQRQRSRQEQMKRKRERETNSAGFYVLSARAESPLWVAPIVFRWFSSSLSSSVFCAGWKLAPTSSELLFKAVGFFGRVGGRAGPK